MHWILKKLMQGADKDDPILIQSILMLLQAVGFTTLAWQYFEFAYKLQEAGIIESAIYSGTFGSPIPHHGYIGLTILVLALIIDEIITWRVIK